MDRNNMYIDPNSPEYLRSQTEGIISSLSPIYLDDMTDQALLRRSDTKFLIDEATLLDLLSKTRSEYDILEVNGARLNPYYTRYFDTEDFRFYAQQHNNQLPRHKIRVRRYLTTGEEFLEVKIKNKEEQTIKLRIHRLYNNRQLSLIEKDFLRDEYILEPDLLRSMLENQFTRFTLVSRVRMERVTVDLDIRFCHGSRIHSLGPVVILEVKQPRFNWEAPLLQELRTMGIRPTGFSKYCMGISSFRDDLKRNRFKARYLQLEEIFSGNTKGYDYGFSY